MFSFAKEICAAFKVGWRKQRREYDMSPTPLLSHYNLGRTFERKRIIHSIWEHASDKSVMQEFSDRQYQVYLSTLVALAEELADYNE